MKKIVHLRIRKRLGPVQIADRVGMPASTVHAVLKRCRLNRLSHVDVKTGEPARRYEHDKPGALIHVDVKKPDGGTERWKVEGGSPSVLFRLGWNRNSLPAGTRVTVVGFQAKDGSLRASSRDLRFPDGRRMDFGGSGSAADEKK